MYRANSPAVRMISLPGLIIYRKVLSYSEVQFKKFCLPVKTSFLLAESTGTVHLFSNILVTGSIVTVKPS